MVAMQALPTLRQLQFFLALARRRSFSKAAEDCLVSQSTLSAAMKELEAILQRQLIDRSTRSFALTPAGEDVVGRAAQIVTLAEEMTAAVATREPLDGAFDLGVIPTVAPFLVPKAATRLKKAYPRLELYLREELTEILIERLQIGALDAALLATPYDAPGIDFEDVGADPFWYAGPSDDPLTEKDAVSLSDLRKTRLLLLEDGHCLRDHAIEACKLRAADAAAAYGATSLLTLAQMVRAGLGATLLPQMAVQAGFAKSNGVKAVPLGPPAPARRIGVAWRRGSGRAEEARALAAVFRDVLD
ncbi:MAG: hydrogen peroxide-inducible genes activator [Pseudomonadota bacterium]